MIERNGSSFPPSRLAAVGRTRPAVRLLRDDRGTVTVEFALVAPVVLLLLALVLAASAVSAEAVRLADAAGLAARALGRDDSAAAAAALARLVPAATIAVDEGELVCVRLDEEASLGPLADAIHLSSRSCAAGDGA